MDKKLIYGKNDTSNIVSIEVEDNKAILFKETANGIEREEVENDYWALYNKPVTPGCIPLDGDLHFGYAKTFETRDMFQKDIGIARYKKGADVYALWNPKEMHMVKTGRTYFKGMTPDQVSVLSFDIETTSLKPTDNDKVLMIANTYRSATGVVTRRMFCYDDYKSTKEMIYAWCSWVQEINPSVICGHNIFGFDIPYLSHFVDHLPIGRDNSGAKISTRTSEFRKEGGQTYSYNNVLVFGREIIDTFHLSIKYDAASRQYSSYKLKTIIKEAGLEVEGREYYDASQIRFNYEDSIEWEKIKLYAQQDGDDSLALFDLMIPPYFYYCQTVPKSLQQIINGASGSQINSWMVRAYLQEGHSIPEASERADYMGAISLGNPGVYDNVKKVDVASLYPSIIRQYKVCDNEKDPKGYFLDMVEYFTIERLRNKQLSKDTGDRKYKDLEQSQKIFINSAYGFLGAAGLNFNSPEKASAVTRKGREILEEGMAWAESKGFTIVNADTDSFSYVGGNNFEDEIEELNAGYPDLIVWEDDGQYDRVVVLKAKNYILKKGSKVSIKGNSLKASNKEPVLKDFLFNSVNLILEGDSDGICGLYHDIVMGVSSINRSNISDWSSKKTVTKAVLNPARTNEQRISEAIQGKGFQEGDKFRVFFETPTKLTCDSDFNGNYDRLTLYKKIYNTLKILAPVIDLDKFLNYSLKRNQAEIPVPRVVA